MKKLLFIFLLLPVFVRAQDSLKWDYIIIIETSRANNLYLVGKGKEVLKSELKEQKFDNVIDAITYLEDRKWRFINFEKEQPCQMCPTIINAYMKKKR